MGRPSSFTQKIADVICERLADGESLRAICRDEAMPPESTVRLWSVSNVNGFAAQYARARDIGLDVMADDLLEISDEPVSMTGEGKLDGADVQHKRLRVDTRKWLLSKLAPKRYGDRLNMELTGKDGGPVEFDTTERAAKVQALVALAEKRKELDGSDVSDLV